MKYLPHTEQERKAMLDSIGVSVIDELFADIPARLAFGGRLNVAPALSDPELARHMSELASRNKTVADYTCFLGAGAYDHYVPSVCDHVIARNEFYTAYTPYQPEVSQGTLQSIFEFQSMMCALTEMAVCNASMYDGATAAAEAALISATITGRKKIVISRTVHPEYRQVVATYATGQGLTVAELPFANGVTDLDAARAIIDQDTASVIIQHPNFFGCLEPVDELEPIIHGAGALYTAAVDPISLGLLKPPGRYGVDFAIGEAQSMGNHLSYGGPYVGFFTANEKHLRRMPGRIVGATEDVEGKRGYVLALQTREQHIRREKATSNICTNEALCALATGVYMSTMGKQGMVRVAELCLGKATYALNRIDRLDRFSRAFSAPVFKEFVVRTTVPPAEVGATLLEHGILGGLDLSKFYPELDSHLLFCVTEKRTREEIDYLVARLEGLV